MKFRTLFLYLLLLSSASCIHDAEPTYHTVQVTITQDNTSRSRFWLGINDQLDYGWHDRSELVTVTSGQSVLIHFMNYHPQKVMITIILDGKIKHQAYHGETVLPIEWEYKF